MIGRALCGASLAVTNVVGTKNKRVEELANLASCFFLLNNLSSSCDWAGEQIVDALTTCARQPENLIYQQALFSRS